MQKINKEDVLTHPEFAKANKFLKDKVMGIVHNYAQKERSIENNHNMVAEMCKLHMDVIASFDQTDLEALKSKDNNLSILNNYLALRQLSETQLGGVLQGSWGVSKSVVDSDAFKIKIGHSESNVSKTEILKFITTE